MMNSIVPSAITVVKCKMPVNNAGVHLRQGPSQGQPQSDLVCVSKDSGLSLESSLTVLKCELDEDGNHLPLFEGLPVCKGVVHLGKIKG